MGPKRDKYDAAADAILQECRDAVDKGLGGKKLSKAADNGLDAFFRPKIKRRLKKGGDWEKEKAKPLIVAEHLGQVAAILSHGSQVSAAVAKAAAVAAKHDEVCPAGGGAGQWCV
jgi:hypothetical protein